MTTTSVERARRGLLGESLAAQFLELHGCRVLQRRLRVADVEIDLLVREGECLVVVEVKLRSTDAQRSLDALSWRQARRLQRAAQVLLSRETWAGSVRIDVVAIDWRIDAGILRMQQIRGATAW